jgi:hypothetical protein
MVLILEMFCYFAPTTSLQRNASAHSSEPESGVNPVARMLELINSLDGKVAFKHNHITNAARYAADNLGLD